MTIDIKKAFDIILAKARPVDISTYSIAQITSLFAENDLNWNDIVADTNAFETLMINLVNSQISPSEVNRRLVFFAVSMLGLVNISPDYAYSVSDAYFIKFTKAVFKQTESPYLTNGKTINISIQEQMFPLFLTKNGFIKDFVSSNYFLTEYIYSDLYGNALTSSIAHVLRTYSQQPDKMNFIRHTLSWWQDCLQFAINRGTYHHWSAFKDKMKNPESWFFGSGSPYDHQFIELFHFIAKQKDDYGNLLFPALEATNYWFEVAIKQQIIQAGTSFSETDPQNSEKIALIKTFSNDEMQRFFHRNFEKIDYAMIKKLFTDEQIWEALVTMNPSAEQREAYTSFVMHYSQEVSASGKVLYDIPEESKQQFAQSEALIASLSGEIDSIQAQDILSLQNRISRLVETIPSIHQLLRRALDNPQQWTNRKSLLQAAWAMDGKATQLKTECDQLIQRLARREKNLDMCTKLINGHLDIDFIAPLSDEISAIMQQLHQEQLVCFIEKNMWQSAFIDLAVIIDPQHFKSALAVVATRLADRESRKRYIQFVKEYNHVYPATDALKVDPQKRDQLKQWMMKATNLETASASLRCVEVMRNSLKTASTVTEEWLNGDTRYSATIYDYVVAPPSYDAQVNDLDCLAANIISLLEALPKKIMAGLVLGWKTEIADITRIVTEREKFDVVKQPSRLLKVASEVAKYEFDDKEALKQQIGDLQSLMQHKIEMQQVKKEALVVRAWPATIVIPSPANTHAENDLPPLKENRSSIALKKIAGTE